MRNLLLLGMIFIQVLVKAQLVDQAKESKFILPLEMKGSGIYIEKFSPIYVQNISESQLNKIYGEDKEDNMSDFVDLLQSYNLVLYRKLNSGIEQNIKELNNSSKVQPVYLRDFKESNDSSIRFIIKNDFSIIDIFVAYHNSDLEERKAKQFNYYVYDKQTNTNYKKQENIELLLKQVNYFYDLENSGKLSNLSKSQLNAKLLKLKLKKVKNKESNGYSWAVYVFGALAFMFNFILG